MERLRKILLICSLSNFLFNHAEALKYVVSAPNIFRLDVPETVGISISEHAVQAVTVEILLQDYPGKTKTISHQRLDVTPGKPAIGHLTFQSTDIPELQMDDEVIFVNLLVRSPAGLFPNKDMMIPVQKYSGFAFLQTDKPIYTPRDIVKIRALNLNEKLLPSDKSFSMEIKNANGHLVFQEDFKPDPKGIIEHTFKFPVFPALGNWSISINYGYQLSGKKTVHFTVDEYVLPTFSVTIEPPKFILSTEKTIEAKIIAKYVYGNPVDGLLNVNFGIKDVNGLITSIGSYKQQKLTNGEKSVFINVEKDIKQKNIQWFPAIDGSRLIITAEVIELATGHRENASDESSIFTKSPYVVSFPRSNLDFKPGVPYQVQVDIKSTTGKPVNKVLVQVVAAVAKVGGRVSRQLQKPMPSTTNALGHVMFELGTGNDEEELEITVSTQDEGLRAENQATNVLKIVKFKSPDGQSYVWIAAPPEDMIFQVGRTFQTQVTAFPAQANIKLHYLVVSRGQILLQRETEREQNAVVHPIQFVVTPEMSPSARLVVYVIKNNYVIADSMRIEVQKTCVYNNGSDLKLAATSASGSFSPGDNVNIEVVGEVDSYVGLLAVDEAVYLLNNEGLLTRQKMFAEMNAQDFGCGSGGGKDPEAVFRRAGLVVLSNAVIGAHGRIKDECKEAVRKRRSIIPPKRVVVEDMYTGSAAICCKIGRLRNPRGMDCIERANKIYDAIGDKENCSQAFLDCCQYELDMKAVYGRIDVGNEDINNMLSSDDLIELLEGEVLKALRHFFPETWIFNTYKIRQTDCDKGVCKLKIATNVPHSITTWRLQAVAVSQKTGMCVANPVNLRVFKPIFIQMKLPYSAVRGEQILLPVTIFNYGEKPLKVSVFMYGIEGVCLGAAPGERSETRVISVPKNSAFTVTFPIMPLEVASYPLRVMAISADGSDAVEKTLHVVPEGMEVIKPFSITLDPTGVMRDRKKRNVETEGIEETFDEERNRQSLVIDMPLPRQFIPGTEKCIITAMGDLLGQSVTTQIQGLEGRFIRLPSGCGEQTMITLAPLVYTMLYLKRTSRLTADIEKNGYSLMQQGYAHMLTYRKADGSFAVWVNHASSTWLTALAAKVFCQARLFINIPDDVSCRALEWTLKKQRNTGAFYADFGVYHQEMTGGIQSEATITAYVLIALMECDKCVSANTKIASSRAISYLETHIDFLNQPYSLAVVTYALALANSPKKNVANAKLKSLSHYDKATDTRFWANDPNEFNQGQKPWVLLHKPSALSVETTSYALLAQLQFDDIAYSHAIANWINQQRNDQGAFVSTQDTIMALQALSEYSYRAKFPELNMLCDITSQASRNKRTLNLTKENSLMLQKVEVPAAGKLHIDVEGRGIGTMSLALHYNIAHNKQANCKFDLHIKAEEADDILMPQMPKPEFSGFDVFSEEVVRSITTPPDQKHKFGYDVDQNNDDNDYDNVEEVVNYQSRHIVQLDICIKYLENRPAGMSILEVGLFTGYKPVKEDLDKLVNDPNVKITEYELTDTSIILYLDTVPHNKNMCVKIRTFQDVSVGQLQPALVKVYDYYEPGKSCEKFYKPDDSSPLLTPICEGRQCRCAEGRCPSCYPFEDAKKIKSTREQRKNILNQACDKYANFVWNGTLIAKDEEESFINYHFHVTQVVKEGLEPKDDLVDEIVTFTGPKACSCPEMEENRNYMIFGKDGFRYKDEDGSWRYKYTFDHKSRVQEMKAIRDFKDPAGQELQKTFNWLYKKMYERGEGCDH